MGITVSEIKKVGAKVEVRRSNQVKKKAGLRECTRIGQNRSDIVCLASLICLSSRGVPTSLRLPGLLTAADSPSASGKTAPMFGKLVRGQARLTLGRVGHCCQPKVGCNRGSFLSVLPGCGMSPTPATAHWNGFIYVLLALGSP